LLGKYILPKSIKGGVIMKDAWLNW